MRYSVGRTWKLVFKMLRAIVKVQVGFSVNSVKALDVNALDLNFFEEQLSKSKLDIV